MSPRSTESHSLSRLDSDDLSCLSAGFIICILLRSLLPPLHTRGHQVSCHCHPTSCTTTNSSRLDSSLVCLGWIRCCTPLPPLTFWTDDHRSMQQHPYHGGGSTLTTTAHQHPHHSSHRCTVMAAMSMATLIAAPTSTATSPCCKRISLHFTVFPVVRKL
jgi:hypothetical protein